MKLKQKAQDFRVRELLAPGYLKDRGRHQVYRVTKKKLTSMEAAARLADMAGVRPSDVGMAGLKDRQGVTVQFMSIAGGRPVFLKTPELRIESAGFASTALTSEASLGNGFEITVRGLEDHEREQIERGLAEVREHGLPNYFGEQRFGNLRHGQGWIARDLARGQHERALRMLMTGRSDNDDARSARFKSAIDEAWGDWRRCREVAGRFGQHISVFQHLTREDGDFAGAFTYVKSQLRLIHLYAWQSHIWNRAVAAYVEEVTQPKDRFVVPSSEGNLVFARGELPVDPGTNGMFRLPGPGLEDVKDRRQHDLLTLALRREGLEPHEFRIEGVSGFQLKGEDRPLVVRPRHLKSHTEPSGRVVVEFELPRGAYATLVMARLVPPVRDDSGRPDAHGTHDVRREPRHEPRRPNPARSVSRASQGAGPTERRGDRPREDRPSSARSPADGERARPARPRGPRSSDAVATITTSPGAQRRDPKDPKNKGAPRGPRSKPARDATPRPGAHKGGKMRPKDKKREKRPKRPKSAPPIDGGATTTPDTTT